MGKHFIVSGEFLDCGRCWKDCGISGITYSSRADNTVDVVPVARAALQLLFRAGAASAASLMLHADSCSVLVWYLCRDYF